MSLRSCLLFVAVLCASAWPYSAHGAEPQTSGVVVVTLSAEAEVTNRLVRVGDVASVAGGNAAVRKRISELDLVELDLAEPSIEVSRLLVEARLLLNGVPSNAFRVEGAASTAVSRQQAHTNEERVLEAVRLAVADELSLSTQEVAVRLAQPLTAELASLVNATPADELRARLTSAPGGRTRVELWVSDARGGQKQTAVLVNVRFRQLAPVAVRPLAARQTLGEGDVVLEMRELTQRGIALTLEQVAGKSLRRSLAAGEVVVEKDLFAPANNDDPVLVNPRDMVRLTAKKGRLTIEIPSAEVLQSGRMGDTVRVRNTTSGRIVVGRVTGPGEVEVPL